MYTIIGIAVAILIAVVVGYAATRPDNFRVERTKTIDASADRIFPVLSDFHQWSAFSPWEKLDPQMKRSFSGPLSGKGAIYGWSGNKQAGEGRMEIVNLSAPNRLTIKLDFLKPFEAHNYAEFRLEPDGDSTRVTWAMYGPQPFLFKVMSIVVSMDKLVGKDFETGLANLNTLLQNNTNQRSAVCN